MSYRVLMIAYHFPPLQGSSGIHRTLNFARELPDFNWQPLVLSVNIRAYENISEDLMKAVPSQLIVRRAFALDAARHLSVFGHYPGWLARPDRWLTWLVGAIPLGLQMIRQWRPDVLWSTYPVASAHLIGAALARLTGIPWVADFRDPMAHDGYPPDPQTWRSFRRVEGCVFANARSVTFTTPGAARLYRSRYPEAVSRITVLENGYDEQTFRQAELDITRHPLNPGCVTLLHSGIVYPEWRNPEHLLEAVSRLVGSGRLDPRRFRLRFRAPVHEQFIRTLVDRYRLSDMVEILPAVSYHEALKEMLCADELLVLQSSGCNEQIPAKLYEYLRAGRPIIGLTDPVGDTAGLLRKAGFHDIAPLDSVSAIEQVLLDSLSGLAMGKTRCALIECVETMSRRERTRAFAELLGQTRLLKIHKN